MIIDGVQTIRVFMYTPSQSESKLKASFPAKNAILSDATD
jgi:hypothetical protein